MKIITCNFRGRKHSERNEPCEDSVFCIQGSEITTVAIADGAGSKKYDHAKEGADAVTRAICEFFDVKFDDFFDSSNELELRSVIQTISHKALKERAQKLNIESIDTMASTLLAVSVKGNKAIAVQIGDGIIGRSFHGELEPVTLPQNGEYASSTYFVNSADAYKMIQVRKQFLTGTSHLFLMSDGVSECMFNDFNGEFNNSLKMLLETASEIGGEKKVKKAVKEFIVDADPMSDDCSLAILCLNEEPVPVETETLKAFDSESVERELSQPVMTNTSTLPLESFVQEDKTEPITENRDFVSDTEKNGMTAPIMLTSESDVAEEADGPRTKSSAAKIVIVTIALIVVIVATAVALVVGSKNKNDAEKTTQIRENTEQTLSVYDDVINEEPDTEVSLEDAGGVLVNGSTTSKKVGSGIITKTHATHNGETESKQTELEEESKKEPPSTLAENLFTGGVSTKGSYEKATR